MTVWMRRRRCCMHIPTILYSLVFLACSVVSAHRHGDPVSVLSRSQYKGYRTEWAEIAAREAPRFAVERTIKFHPYRADHTYESNEEYKLSFSFDRDRFLTPWVTVTDGHGSHLERIQFEFVFSGDHIRQVKWTTDYRSVPGDRPDHIHVQYHWTEYVEIDTAFGFDFLLVVCMTSTVLVAALVLFRSDAMRKGKKRL